MSQLLASYNLRNDQTLKNRARAAMVKLATSVLADSSRSTEHPYFQEILNSPDSDHWLAPLMWDLATNVTILNNYGGPDSDIEFVLISSVPKYVAAFNAQVQ